VSTSTYKSKVTASKIVCISRDPAQQFKTGRDQDSVDVVEDAMMVVAHDGSIVAIGPTAELAETYATATFDETVDCVGKTILPGFVDAVRFSPIHETSHLSFPFFVLTLLSLVNLSLLQHTHPVWAGDRVNEFRMKLAGAKYMDIHAMGGGIGYTVTHTRAASEDELLASLLVRLRKALASGTTLLEAKSGYGLEGDSEMKMLRVIRRAKSAQPVELVANFCGAHSVPKGSTAAAATEDIVSAQLPRLKELMAAGEVDPEQIDVFCESGVFDVTQARRILEAGQALGLSVNFHGDELTTTHSAEMAAQIGARAVSHLECVTDDGIAAMAHKKVAAVLLPTTAYVLRLEPPPARALIDAGAPVALGSDFNPNAYCISMPLVMNMACVLLRMTCNEALVGATLNAAYALGRAHSHGSLAPGKRADFVVLGTESWEHIVYQMGQPPIHAVYKGGTRVSSDVEGLASVF
jgi:imidazolonepropionase